MTAAPTTPTPARGDWWQLPSGRVVSVRRIDGEGADAEAAVRYVDAHGAMATGEFTLAIPFIAKGRKVGHES